MRIMQLDSWHRTHGKMVEFAGWEMPIWYEGISQEHMSVREHIGIFDVSHMGEIFFEGPDALKFLQWVTTNDISKPPPISGTYTLVLNERGAIKDETLVYNMGNETYMMVCDAVALPKLIEYFNIIYSTINKFGKIELNIEDKTMDTELYSIQGPYSRALCKDIFGLDVDKLWWFQAKEVEYDGHQLLLSKSGYTGETGFELFFDNTKVPSEKIWNMILDEGKKYGIRPCGLGSRDTLRIEAGYTLYGNETNELQILSEEIDSITPLEAGMEFAISYDKDFIGKQSLEKQKARGAYKKLIHLRIKGKTIPRPGDSIVCNGSVIGTITSGTKSIILNEPIAMGFVDDDSCTSVQVIVRSNSYDAKIIEPPFYNTKRYGANREVGI